MYKGVNVCLLLQWLCSVYYDCYTGVLIVIFPEGFSVPSFVWCYYSFNLVVYWFIWIFWFSWTHIVLYLKILPKRIVYKNRVTVFQQLEIKLIFALMLKMLAVHCCVCIFIYYILYIIIIKYCYYINYYHYISISNFETFWLMCMCIVKTEILKTHFWISDISLLT